MHSPQAGIVSEPVCPAKVKPEKGYLQVMMSVVTPAVIRPARTRFAPSPTGDLHLGHAYSALTVWRAAGRSDALFCLRIDDLDHTRCRPAYTQQIIDDLSWLGISWAEAPLVQSARLHRYATALEQLRAAGLVYPCYLTRRELSSFLTAPQDGGTAAQHGRAAPSTKGVLSEREARHRETEGQIPAWRLDSRKALARAGKLAWQDSDGASHAVDSDQFEIELGDVILGRRDIAASYHLSVVLDDADSEIELVVRGEDLAASTPVHRLLQELLGLPVPVYLHHPLVRDDNGRRLAKRDQDRSLKSLREAGVNLQDVEAMMPAFVL